MKNSTPQNQNGVLSLLVSMYSGAIEHGENIGLAHMTAAVLLATRVAAVAARNVFEAGKELLRVRRTAVSNAMDQAREFATLAREVLKPLFGSLYNERWDVAGFVGSLAMPATVDDMLILLETLQGFFTANPTLELGPRVTAAQAQLLFDTLSNARSAVESQRTIVDDLMSDRDTKLTAARTAIRDLINELDTLIDPLDARWLSFGLNKPGAQETPDQVVNVQATLIGPTAAAVKWPVTARAVYFRIWKKVLGVDEAPVAVGSPADLDFTIEHLPTGSTIEIYVSAVNDGGESPLSEKITIVTHA